MIGFEPHQQVDIMRANTTKELGTSPLVDDNHILRALRLSGYLANRELVGYLPSAFYLEAETGNVELFVGEPLGEYGLTRNGGAHFNYESTHRRLLYLLDYVQGLRYDTGHVVETKDAQRFYISKSTGFTSKVSQGEFGNNNDVLDELTRLGIDGLAEEEPYVTEYLFNVVDLSLTRAIREAAKWVGYTLQEPWDPDKQKYLPTTLSFDEATTCLRAFFVKLRNRETERDIDLIRRHTDFA